MTTGLNSNSGRIGTGAAQVFDSSSSINTYAKILAQQKAQREKEVGELQNYLSTAKTDGLRDADRDDYFKLYDTWRDESVEAYKAKGLEGAKLKAKANMTQSKLNRLVAESKEYGKLHADVSMKGLDNNFRDQFDDNGWNEWMASGKRALSDSKIMRDPSVMKRVVDMSKVMDDFKKVDAEILDNHAKYDPVQEVNNKKGYIDITKIKRGDPKTQHEYYMHLVTANKSAKLFIKQKYPQLFATMPEQEAMALATKDFAENRPLIREEMGGRKDEDYISELDRERLNISKANLALRAKSEARQASKDSEGSNINDYPIERIELISQPTYDRDNKLIDTPLKKIILDKSVKVRSVAFPSTQIASAYSVSEGKKVRLDAKDDLKLARLAYTRTNAKDGRYELKAVVVDDSGEYILDEREIPIDIRKTVPYKTAKSALGSPPRNSVKSKTSSNPQSSSTPKVDTKQESGDDPKKIKMATPVKTKTVIIAKDIPAKAKAAGYTTPEYMELLKKRGIKIVD